MASIPGYVTLYTTRAHVFQINTETKTSWLPKGDSAIPISFVTSQLDTSPNKKELKIIGTSDNGEFALDCVISWVTVFNKRSQKFVQWPDQTGMVYGLGFNSEADLNEFIETFMELQQKILTNSLNIGRHQPEWNATQQQIVNSSEINGRVAEQTSGRTSGSQYSNTLQGGTSNDASGTVEPINRASPDMDESNDQLKYENERLKQALEESSKNSVVWQNELMNLRTNNVKLTQALQESKAHVEEWEKELINLRDANKKLQMRIMWLESNSNGSKCDNNHNGDYTDEMQNELKRKDSELEKLRNALEQMEIKSINNLKEKLDIIAAKLLAKTNELNNVQKELTQLVGNIQDNN